MAKLSDIMLGALLEIQEKGITKARKATTDALIKRGLIECYPNVTDEFKLTSDGREAIGVESDGDFAPENIASAIQDIESAESDDPVVPFFNRKALRNLRRNQARANRRKMYDQGKRRRKYGADDLKYVARKLAA